MNTEQPWPVNLQMFPEKIQDTLSDWRPEGPDDEILKRSLDTPDWSIELLWRVAAFYHIKLAYNNAAPYYHKLLQWTEYDPLVQSDVLVALGHIFLLKGDSAQGLHALRSAIKLGHAGMRVHYYLAEAYESLQQQDDAMKSLVQFCKYYSLPDQLLLRAWRKLIMHFDSMAEFETVKALFAEAQQNTGLDIFAFSGKFYQGVLAYHSDRKVLEEVFPNSEHLNLFEGSKELDFLSEGLCENFAYREIFRKTTSEAVLKTLKSQAKALQPLATQFFNVFPRLGEPTRRITAIGELNSPHMEPYLDALIEVSRRHTITFLSIGKIPDILKQEQWMRVIHVPNNLNLIYQALQRHSPQMLLYLNLGPHQIHAYAMATQKLAPIQCVLGSYPVSSGLESIDYFLSLDAFEPPDADAAYSENLQRLQGTPTKAVWLPEHFIERKYFNLPTESNNYICLAPVSNLHQDFIPYLAEILEQDPQGQIFLPWYAQTNVNHIFRLKFAQNYEGLFDRLHFLPPMQELGWYSLLRHADLLLDPMYVGPFTAAWRWIELGTPIVSWKGPQMTGRFVSQLYERLNLLDSIVEQQKDYAKRAVELANNKALKSHYRSFIQANKEKLYDFNTYVDSLEAFFSSHLA